jgi:hypothetical protein
VCTQQTVNDVCVNTQQTVNGVCTPNRLLKLNLHKADTHTLKKDYGLLHSFNPLNAELNPICDLLALLGAHLIVHVSRIRVKIEPKIQNQFSHVSVVNTLHNR